MMECPGPLVRHDAIAAARISAGGARTVNSPRRYSITTTGADGSAGSAVAAVAGAVA